MSPAYFTSGVVANTQAWHQLAEVHDEATDGKLYADEAIKKGGLDWQVYKDQVYRLGEPVEDKFFTVNAQNEQVLGIVGNRYTPIQNEDAFRFLNDLVDSDDLEIETAISLRGGRSIAVLARRPDEVYIAGEQVDPYICFFNAHDGSGAARTFTTPVRVVCQNTLSLALDTAKRTYSIRHTASAPAKLEEARKALQVTFAYTSELQQLGEGMAAEKMSLMNFAGKLEHMIPAPTEKGRARTNALNIQQAITQLYMDEENLNNIRGTAWGGLQAIVQYEQWEKRHKNPDTRFENVVGGMPLSQLALTALSES